MVALIIGMLICVALALAVVALVAVPARRQGRDIFTPRGEDVVSALKDRQTAARQRLERGDDPDGTHDPLTEGPEATEATEARQTVGSLEGAEGALAKAAPAPAASTIAGR